jgi:uncharacterized protein
MIDEDLTIEAARRLRAAAPDAEIILFGTAGSGDGGPFGSLQFLIVEPDVADAGEEAVRLRRVLRDVLVPIDIFVVSEAELERSRGVHGSLVHHALRDGRVLAD